MEWLEVIQNLASDLYYTSPTDLEDVPEPEDDDIDVVEEDPDEEDETGAIGTVVLDEEEED